MQKRIEMWTQMSGDTTTTPRDRGQPLSRSPPTGDAGDGPLPTLTTAHQVDGTLSCLHDNGKVPQLSDLLSVLERGGSTVEVKPTSSEFPNGGNRGTAPSKMAGAHGPSTVSMATPRMGLPMADRDVSVCAGSKVGVAVALLPQQTTNI